VGVDEDGKDETERHENKLRGIANVTGRKKSYGCDMESGKQEEWRTCLIMAEH